MRTGLAPGAWRVNVKTASGALLDRFRDRKNIARFYQRHQIKPGDHLELSADNLGKWHARKI